jgi:hypothetical protein
MAKKDIKKEALKMYSERQRASARMVRDTRQTAAAKAYKTPKPAGKTTVPSEIQELRQARSATAEAKSASAGRMQRLAGATERMNARAGSRAAIDAAAREAGKSAIKRLAGRALRYGGALGVGFGVASVAKDAYDAGKKLESAMRPTAKSGPATAKGSVQISAEQAAKMKAKDAYPIVRGATAAKMAGKVSEFGQAFAAARKKLGKSGTFEYKGKKYNTRYKGE